MASVHSKAIFLRRSLTAGVSALAVMTSVAAFAQTAPEPKEEELETIVISGIRASLESSIELKRSSDLIVESVVAEDIGKLPDNSIAESISRLPGIATQRLDGRSQVLSIRGLAPDFTTTLLNGREQVTPGNNRGVEFDQFPAEVLNSVLVYKSADAALIGQGMAGTVDLRTIRPLAKRDRVIAVGARAEYLEIGKLNAGSNDIGYRFYGTYVDQLIEDKLGIAVSFSHMNSPTHVERFNAWGYPNVNPSTVVIGGSKPFVGSADLKRTGVVGTLEFKPTDNFTTTVDAYYSKFKDDAILRGIELPLFWSAAQLQPGFTAQNGIVTSGTFNGVKGVVRNDAFSRDADLFSVGWNGAYSGDDWKFVADVSYSKVDRTDQIIESYSGTGRGPLGATDNIRFVTTPGDMTRFTGSLNYGDPNLIRLTSPQGWGGDVIPGGQDGYFNQPSIEDELWAFRASAEKKFDGVMEALEVGVNYSDRSKELTPDEFFLGLKGNTNGTTSVALPSNLFLGVTNLDFLGLPGIISYDPRAVIDAGLYNLVRNPNADVAAKGWTVSEKVITGWVRGKIRADIAPGELTGNFGFQVVHTDQESTGQAASGRSGFVTVRGGDKYTYVLPSLNLILRPSDQSAIRFAIAKQMARPLMNDMRAAVNFGFNQNLAGPYLRNGQLQPITNPNNSPFNGDGGNPELKPWRANAVDLSFEHYFDKQTYVALAGFYKDLKTYIYNQPVVRDFAGVSTPFGPAASPSLGSITAPANGEGGTIQGFELSGSLAFKTLSETLDGFGVLGSISYTDSAITPDPGNPSRPLEGFSKWVWNAQAYYEKHGFQARASVRYRSEFLANVSGFGAGRELRLAVPETLLDAQIGYEFQSGSLKGLAILLQGYNLTDEPFITYNLNAADPKDSSLVIDNQRYGRRFLFGISYKL